MIPTMFGLVHRGSKYRDSSGRRWCSSVLVLGCAGCPDDPTPISTDPGTTTAVVTDTDAPPPETTGTTGDLDTTATDGGSSSSDDGEPTTTGVQPSASLRFLLEGLVEETGDIGVYRFDYVDGALLQPVTIATGQASAILSASQSMLLVGYEPPSSWQLVPLVDGDPGRAVDILQAPAPVGGEMGPPSIIGDESALLFSAWTDPMGDDLRVYRASTDGITVSAPELVFDEVPAADSSGATQVNPSADLFARYINPAGDPPINWWLGSLATPDPAGIIQISDLTLPTQGSFATNYWGFVGDDMFLYNADRDIDGVLELFAVDVSGPIPGSPTRIHPPLTPTQETRTVRVSPDGTRLVYWLGESVDTGDIFMLDIMGGTASLPIQLSTLGDDQSYVGDLGWSPDGRWVHFRASYNEPSTLDLYMVDVSGPSPSAPMLTTGGLLPGGDIMFLDFDATGQWLYYSAEQQMPYYEVYRVDVSGDSPGPTQRLSGDPVDGVLPIGTYSVSEDNSRLLYQVGPGIDVVEIYAVDISGADAGAPQPITEPLGPGRELVLWTRISADGEVAMYQDREANVSDAPRALHLVEIASDEVITVAFDADDVTLLD